MSALCWLNGYWSARMGLHVNPVFPWFVAERQAWSDGHRCGDVGEKPRPMLRLVQGGPR